MQAKRYVMIKLKNLITEAETKWSGLSQSKTQIPAVATRQRKQVEKVLQKLRIPIKPHEFKNNSQRTIYTMDKKHIMTFVKAMDKADMFWMIPFPKALGKPIKESVNEAKFTKQQIDIMRKSYGSLKSINPNSPTYKKFIKFLDKLPKDHLKQLAGANIKWISILAKNRLRGESVNEAIPKWPRINMGFGEAQDYSKMMIKKSQDVFKSTKAGDMGKAKKAVKDMEEIVVQIKRVLGI